MASAARIRIEIERCEACWSHAHCTRHDEKRYEGAEQQVREAIREVARDLDLDVGVLDFVTNPGPLPEDHRKLSRGVRMFEASWNQGGGKLYKGIGKADPVSGSILHSYPSDLRARRVMDRARAVVRYPRLGAFEVYVCCGNRRERVFSKLDKATNPHGFFPRPKHVADNVRRIVCGLFGWKAAEKEDRGNARRPRSAACARTASAVELRKGRPASAASGDCSRSALSTAASLSDLRAEPPPSVAARPLSAGMRRPQSAVSLRRAPPNLDVSSRELRNDSKLSSASALALRAAVAEARAREGEEVAAEASARSCTGSGVDDADCEDSASTRAGYAAVAAGVSPVARAPAAAWTGVGSHVGAETGSPERARDLPHGSGPAVDGASAAARPAVDEGSDCAALTTCAAAASAAAEVPVVVSPLAGSANRLGSHAYSDEFEESIADAPASKVQKPAVPVESHVVAQDEASVSAAPDRQAFLDKPAALVKEALCSDAYSDAFEESARPSPVASKAAECPREQGQNEQSMNVKGDNGVGIMGDAQKVNDVENSNTAQVEDIVTATKRAPRSNAYSDDFDDSGPANVLDAVASVPDAKLTAESALSDAAENLHDPKPATAREIVAIASAGNALFSTAQNSDTGETYVVAPNADALSAERDTAGHASPSAERSSVAENAATHVVEEAVSADIANREDAQDYSNSFESGEALPPQEELPPLKCKSTHAEPTQSRAVSNEASGVEADGADIVRSGCSHQRKEGYEQFECLQTGFSDNVKSQKPPACSDTVDESAGTQAVPTHVAKHGPATNATGIGTSQHHDVDAIVDEQAAVASPSNGQAPGTPTFSDDFEHEATEVASGATQSHHKPQHDAIKDGSDAEVDHPSRGSARDSAQIDVEHTAKETLSRDRHEDQRCSEDSAKDADTNISDQGQPYSIVEKGEAHEADAANVTGDDGVAHAQVAIGRPSEPEGHASARSEGDISRPQEVCSSERQLGTANRSAVETAESDAYSDTFEGDDHDDITSNSQDKIDHALRGASEGSANLQVEGASAVRGEAGDAVSSQVEVASAMRGTAGSAVSSEVEAANAVGRAAGSTASSQIEVASSQVETANRAGEAVDSVVHSRAATNMSSTVQHQEAGTQPATDIVEDVIDTADAGAESYSEDFDQSIPAASPQFQGTTRPADEVSEGSVLDHEQTYSDEFEESLRPAAAVSAHPCMEVAESLSYAGSDGQDAENESVISEHESAAVEERRPPEQAGSNCFDSYSEDEFDSDAEAP